MWNRCLELLWFPLPAVGINSQCWLHSTLSDGLLYEHALLGSVFLSFILGTVSKMWVLRPDWVVDSPPFHPRLAAYPVPRTCSFWDTQGWSSPETWQSWTDFKFCHNFLFPPLMNLELHTYCMLFLGTPDLCDLKNHTITVHMFCTYNDIQHACIVCNS